MHNDLLIDIALVIGLGMFAQWVAWRTKQPSILFLLLIGLAVGPWSTIWRGTPLLDVRHFMGDLLFPFVSAAVGVILFEGGLSLRFRDLEGTGRVVGKLVTLGVLVTWGIATLAATFLLDLNLEIALLLSATLVVTGPTVIIPLLKQIRPKGRVASILRWEGIVIDPVGALLAVLVFDAIRGPHPAQIVLAIFVTLIIGIVIGWLTAQLMIELYRRYWVPDSLQNPMTLGFVIAAFTISNMLQAESGLFTVTVMGIVMANQNRLDIRHIIEFKETLQVLLLSALFILLSARMQPADLQQIGLPTLLFVLVIVVVARPLSVWVSTMGSALTWKERVFISWMAPRGIVAASVASVFALELTDLGVEGASTLLPVAFAVIIGTVTIYSLTSGILARQLELAERNPQGLLIVGASRWIREIGKQVKAAGFRVVLVDTNQAQVDRARKDGLDVYHGSIVSEIAEDEISFGGIGRLLAMTPNAAVNALAGEHFATTFGSENVFELQHITRDQREGISQRLGGRTLFHPATTYDSLNSRFQSGARIMTIEIDEVRAAQNAIPNALLPLFVLPDAERLVVWTEHDTPTLRKGNRLIALVESEFYDDLVKTKAIKANDADDASVTLPELKPI